MKSAVYAKYTRGVNQITFLKSEKEPDAAENLQYGAKEYHFDNFE